MATVAGCLRRHAKGKVHQSLHAVDPLRAVFELLGLIPDYTCGEARPVYAGRVVQALRSEISCAQIEEQPGESANLVVVHFDPGCKVGKHTLAGIAQLSFSGGDSRFDAQVDLRQAIVDGMSMQLVASYESCGDSATYSASGEGALTDNVSFRARARVQAFEGPVLFGSSTFVFDGAIEIIRPDGIDKVVITSLTYELGDAFPKLGSLLIECADGQSVGAQVVEGADVFHPGKLILEVDGHAPSPSRFCKPRGRLRESADDGAGARRFGGASPLVASA